MGGRSHEDFCPECGSLWGGVGWDYDEQPECPCSVRVPVFVDSVDAAEIPLASSQGVKDCDCDNGIIYTGHDGIPDMEPCPIHGIRED